MKSTLVALGLALGAVAAHAATIPTPGQTNTATVIETVVATRDAKTITVLPFGQFFHRYDHILAAGQLELKPEVAIERGYTRCPECLPPRSTEELNSELASGGPKISRYYTEYLRERKDPKYTDVPPGSLPVLDAAPAAPRPAAPAAPVAAAPSAAAKK